MLISLKEWPIEVRAKTLIRLFRISDRTLTSWLRTALPKTKTGHYDLEEVIAWRSAALQERQAGGGRAKLLDAQIRRIEQEIRTKDGELIPIECHNRALAEIAVIVSTRLDGLGPRIASEVVGQTDVAVIQELVLRETRAIRDAIAATIDASADPAWTDPVRDDNPAAADADSRPVGRRKQNSPA